MATDLTRIRSYWSAECEAADRYRALAQLDEEHRALLEQLAADEDRHARHWRHLLVEAGESPAPPARTWRTRALVALARVVGVQRVLGGLARRESRDRHMYRGEPLAAPGMAADEAAHAQRLGTALTPSGGTRLELGQARHRSGARGSLRAAVFGVNDGLVSNLALIMGVAGGAADPGLVVLAGVAGLVAGAGSMAAGEWISVKSQRELLEREIEVERGELEAFPDEEQAELEAIYRAKGLAADEAAMVAARVMAVPETALDTLVREELGLDPGDLGSPWVAAGSSFVAFALGAIVPLLPFLFAAGPSAVLVSALLSMAALAGVGATISLFTGRTLWWSALRMVLIGGVTALATFGVGAAVGVGLS